MNGKAPISKNPLNVGAFKGLYLRGTNHTSPSESPELQGKLQQEVLMRDRLA